MTARKNKPNPQKPSKEPYLKIPYHILNLRDLGLCEKVLLAHIYSFGVKGCWQGNTTLGTMFFVKDRTISRWIAKLKKNGYLLWIHPKGRYRTLWAKSHPQIQKASTLSYMGESISKDAVINGRAEEKLLRQICPGGIDTPSVLTTTNSCIQVGHNWRHTNNTTIKETTKQTSAPPSPSPLPAGGPAPAVLAERTKADLERIEQFKKTFGIGRNAHQPLNDEEFEKRRQENLLALSKS